MPRVRRVRFVSVDGSDVGVSQQPPALSGPLVHLPVPLPVTLLSQCIFLSSSSRVSGVQCTRMRTGLLSVDETCQMDRGGTTLVSVEDCRDVDGLRTADRVTAPQCGVGLLLPREPW